MKFDKPTIVVFAVSIFLIILKAIEEDFINKFSFGLIPTYIASTAAVFAIVFMSFDFISATRFRFLEKFAGGLDILYRFHGYIGKIAAVIIIAHPLFLVIQRFTGIETITRFFIPGSIEFFNWGIFAFWLLLLFVVLTIFVKMPYGIWKYTHMLMSVVFIFASYHVLLDFINVERSPGITLREGIILFIILLGLLSLVYKQFIYPFLAKKFKVVEVKPMGLVTEVYMHSEKKMNFIPGQYIFMAVTDNPELPNEVHPFGITSGQGDENLRVSIKALGDFTKNAGLMKPGNTINVWGPYGMFNWETLEKYKKVIWIGGGIGVAPFLAMGKYAKEINSDKDITLFYVEKNAGECEYNDELTKLSQESNIKFKNHYDDTDGFLTAKAVQEVVGDVKDAVVMICGPKVMMMALKKQFLELGLKPEQIREEVFTMKP